MTKKLYTLTVYTNKNNSNSNSNYSNDDDDDDDDDVDEFAKVILSLEKGKEYVSLENEIIKIYDIIKLNDCYKVYFFVLNKNELEKKFTGIKGEYTPLKDKLELL